MSLVPLFRAEALWSQTANRCCCIDVMALQRKQTSGLPRSRKTREIRLLKAQGWEFWALDLERG